jgi:hypothetical protein
MAINACGRIWTRNDSNYKCLVISHFVLWIEVHHSFDKKNYLCLTLFDLYWDQISKISPPKI